MDETLSAIIVGIFTAIGSGVFGYFAARRKANEARKSAKEAQASAGEAKVSASTATTAGAAAAAITPSIGELEHRMAQLTFEADQIKEAYNLLKEDHQRDMHSLAVLEAIVKELQDARREDTRLISQLRKELGVMRTQLLERDETIRRQAETIVELQNRLSKVEKKQTGELNHD